MGQVHRIGDDNPDGTTQVLAALHECIGAIEDGTINPNKVLILTLRDRDDEGAAIYDPRWFNAGLRASECLALCDIAKTMFKQLMNFIPGN